MARIQILKNLQGYMSKRSFFVHLLKTTWDKFSHNSLTKDKYLSNKLYGSYRNTRGPIGIYIQEVFFHPLKNELIRLITVFWTKCEYLNNTLSGSYPNTQDDEYLYGELYGSYPNTLEGIQIFERQVIRIVSKYSRFTGTYSSNLFDKEIFICEKDLVYEKEVWKEEEYLKQWGMCLPLISSCKDSGHLFLIYTSWSSYFSFLRDLV